MITSLEEIGEEQSVEYTGDVRVIGNIGKKARIIIKNGSLLVEGQIASEVQITLINEPTSSLVSLSQLYEPPEPVSLHVSGTVAEKATIKAAQANITINGTLGSESKISIRRGTICATNIGRSSILQNMQGDIHCRDVGDEAQVKTHIGSIHARCMARRSRALTYKGNINIESADRTAELTSFEGHVYQRGNELKDMNEFLWGKRARVLTISPF